MEGQGAAEGGNQAAAVRGAPCPAVDAHAPAGGLFASWRSSIRVRYLIISLLAALVPLGVVVVLYDHYVENLVLSAVGERLETGLAASSSKLADFLKSRIYQLESLADYPGVTQLAKSDAVYADSRLMAVVRHEVDNPDIYGLVFLDGSDRVLRTLTAQGAVSGEDPILGRAGLVRSLPHVSLHEIELIGPAPARDGRPGWFLLRRRISGEEISLALQVRLASLTELLSAHATLGVYRAVLLAPGDKVFTAVGIDTALPDGAEVVKGPEIAPGWLPAMLRDPQRLPASTAPFRLLLIALATLSALAILALYVHLSRRMRRQISPLIDGAQAVARGDLAWRIAERGGDEIALLAKALNHMSEKLRAMIDAQIEVEKRAVLGDFATSVAHEVRNPLATMKASVQALIMAERDAERREMLALIADEIDRVNGVIETLLHYARPTSPQHSPVAARELFRRVAALVGPLAEETGVSLSLSGDRDLELLVDPKQLQQVLMNLALNAIQAMPGGGVLGLRAQRDGRWGVLMVTDTGAGIEPAMLERVTEPFFTTKAGGTGLGLAISHQLVELNGGALSIASTPGAGTAVTLRLPCTEPYLLSREEAADAAGTDH